MPTKIKNIFRKSKGLRLAAFIYDHCNIAVGRSPAYLRFYRRLARLVESFEQAVHKDIYTDSFDERTTFEFFHFIKSSQPLKHGHNAYRASSVRNFKQKTISALRKAQKCGYPVNLDYILTYSAPDEDSCAVYLTEQEVERLNNLKLNKEQAQIRDLFVIGCCTALRYSDYSRLTIFNFVGDNITILTKKTDTRVVIPIHRFVKQIIERNGGYFFLEYKNSQQNFNCVIKTICKKVGINGDICVERTEGFKKIRKKYKKYELISSHTARRSGATNMYLAGISPFRIMLITGHKTEAAFYRYIRIMKEENAKNLQNHAFFKGTT